MRVLLIGRDIFIAQTTHHFLATKSRRQSKTMVMSSSIFAQRYVYGRSYLRYLPLNITMNGTLNHPGRLPKLL
jgi:hypothetical protein